MRVITEHHDGHGLNEALEITADDQDPNAGGASHRYAVDYVCPDATILDITMIGFQHGPRDVKGSHPGITEAVLYAILLDRLRGFQAGPYACPENDAQITLLEAALALTKARADARAARGVLGKNEK